MAQTISAFSEAALTALFPTVKGRENAGTWLVDQLVDAELHRRGTPDKTSGAFHALALNQGALMREEYDLSTHGHVDGWVIGALLIDPREFILLNQRHNFAVGDAVLKALVDAMKAQCPTAKTVRIHGDGFAILHGPTADAQVRIEQLEPLRNALVAAVKKTVPADSADARQDMVFTLSVLELTVVEPPNWQVLGPLIWAECERALMIARRRNSIELQRRTLVLNGRLPELPSHF